MKPLLLAATLLSLTLGPANAAVRTWMMPELDGMPIGTCLADAKSCGKPAADYWCKSAGYDEALIFEREREMRDSVRIPDSQILAPGTAFRRIKCISAKANLETAMR